MEDKVRFLEKSLQLIMNNLREAEPVYTFWQINIDKIDKSLTETMPIFASQILDSKQQERRVLIANVFAIFSSLIRHFPLGDRSINIEMAIKGYQINANVFTRQEYPAEWANAQYNLGMCYRERIEGNRKQNLELAIAAYRASFAIFTRTTFPVDWADTQTSLADVYIMERLEGNRKQNLELAIAAYRASLEVYTRQAFPDKWARNQVNLGGAYIDIDRIEGNHKENIELAIAAYRAALEVYTRESFPSEWKDIQANLVVIASQYWPVYFAPYLMALEDNTRENFPSEDDRDFLPNSKIPVRMLNALGNYGLIGFLLECTSHTS